MSWHAFIDKSPFFAVIAALAEIGLLAWRLYLGHRERLIKQARPEERAALVKHTFGFFDINTRRLTEQHSYDVALLQIQARNHNFSIGAWLILALLVFLSMVAYFWRPDRGAAKQPVAAESALRVSYYTVGGHALDFLIHGMLDKKWEATLGGQPFIVPNDVFEFAKGLAERYTLPFNERFLTRNTDYSDPDESAAQRFQGKSLFVAGYRLLGLDSSATEEDFQTLQNGSPEWHLEWTGAPLQTPSALAVNGTTLPVNPAAYYFWRFLTANDLAIASRNPALEQTWLRFYRSITGKYFPPDFGIVSVYYLGCAQAGVLMLAERDPMIRVAVLENLSDGPLRIGTAEWKEVRLRRLRSEDEDAKMMDSAAASQHNIFPAQLLAAHEKIVIPLRLIMAYENSKADQARHTPDKIPDELELPVQVQGEGNKTLKISGDTLTAYLNKPKVEPDMRKAYVAGPSIAVTAVEVNGVRRALRQFDPHVLILKSGSYTGSCPYLFTYSTQNKRWESEGPILYGFRSKEKEAWDRKEVKNFDGRLLIRELDAETSWIDTLEVDLACPGRAPVILLPNDHRLQRVDRKYLTLKQGESTLVSFSGVAARGCKATVRSFGYYVPSPSSALSAHR